MICPLRTPSSSQSPLGFVSACGENCTRSLAPPLPTKPASLGFCGGPITGASAGVRQRLSGGKVDTGEVPSAASGLVPPGLSIFCAPRGRLAGHSPGRAKFAGSRTGRRGTFSYTRVVTLRLLTTPGFPPTRTGLRAAVRPCARPRSSPSGLFATAPRFSESTQRACIGGAPFMWHKRHAPWIPPSQPKCTDSFPADFPESEHPVPDFTPRQAPYWVLKTTPILSAQGRSPSEEPPHRRVQGAGKLCWHLY